MFKKYFPEWGVERFHKFGKRFLMLIHLMLICERLP